MPSIQKFSDLAEFIGDEKYSFTLSKKGDVEFSQKDLEVLLIMGAKKSITEKKNYVLIRNGGKVKHEHQSNGSIALRGFTLGGDYYRGIIDKDGIQAKFQDASKNSKIASGVVLSVYDNSTKLKVGTFVFDAVLNIL